MYYAVDGYTNKEVAEFMNFSERSVVNRYHEIYDKLGVDGKDELVSVMYTAMGKNKGE